MVQVAIPVRAVGLPKNKKRQTLLVTVYFTYMGCRPHRTDCYHFCTSRDLVDVINCAEFHNDRSRGYGEARVQKSHAPIGKRNRP
jgi:hypothetical protein